MEHLGFAMHFRPKDANEMEYRVVSEDIKILTQLSMTYLLLMNVIMLTTVGILTFMSRKK